MRRPAPESALWFVVVILAAASLWARDAGVELHSRPEGDSPIVAVLQDGKPLRVLRLVEGWAEVQQGEVRGWTRLLLLWQRSESQWHLAPGAERFFQSQLLREIPPPDSPLTQFGELLDFAFGNAEAEARMRDPQYKLRMSSFSSQWGPLFYHKTAFYYWRGIQLVDLWGDRLRLNLVKGKYNYGAMFGGLWSDSEMDAMVQGNQGVLSNRSLFGEGRNYFLELRYSF